MSSASVSTCYVRYNGSKDHKLSRGRRRTVHTAENVKIHIELCQLYHWGKADILLGLTLR